LKVQSDLLQKVPAAHHCPADHTPLETPVQRLLYGVQGTGNGHISRAAAMNKALAETGRYDVHWAMSGRSQQPLMCCDDYHWYRGMTFVTRDGRIRMLDTLAGNDVFQFMRDIRNARLDDYDLIISDFEPVISWAGRQQGREVIGVGHQYAFYHDVPVAGYNPAARLLMKYFAPADTKVGLHWHHFDQPILPPIVDMHSVDLSQAPVRNKVLVYLPFENQDALVQMFSDMPDWQFTLYHADMENFSYGNIHTRAISKTGFKNDLVTSEYVITNSGFELISECLPLGKRILTKPLHGQIEQLSNARALEELGYARVIKRLDRDVIRQWLQGKAPVFRVQYPDVARAIAQWLGEKDRVSIAALSKRLWSDTVVSKVCE